MLAEDSARKLFPFGIFKPAGNTKIIDFAGFKTAFAICKDLDYSIAQKNLCERLVDLAVFSSDSVITDDNFIALKIIFGPLNVLSDSRHRTRYIIDDIGFCQNPYSAEKPAPAVFAAILSLNSVPSLKLEPRQWETTSSLMIDMSNVAIRGNTTIRDNIAQKLAALPLQLRKKFVAFFWEYHEASFFYRFLAKIVTDGILPLETILSFNNIPKIAAILAVFPDLTANLLIFLDQKPDIMCHILKVINAGSRFFPAMCSLSKTFFEFLERQKNKFFIEGVLTNIDIIAYNLHNQANSVKLMEFLTYLATYNGDSCQRNYDALLHKPEEILQLMAIQNISAQYILQFPIPTILEALNNPSIPLAEIDIKIRLKTSLTVKYTLLYREYKKNQENDLVDQLISVYAQSGAVVDFMYHKNITVEELFQYPLTDILQNINSSNQMCFFS